MDHTSVGGPLSALEAVKGEGGKRWRSAFALLLEEGRTVGAVKWWGGGVVLF